MSLFVYHKYKLYFKNNQIVFKKMYYSEEYKTQWILPPRTGSRMVSKILKHLGFQILGGHHIFNLYDKEWDLNVLIRNPYSRAVSHWIMNAHQRHNQKLPYKSFKNSIFDRENYIKNTLDETWIDPSEFIYSNSISNYKIIRNENLYQDLLSLDFIQENLHNITELLMLVSLENRPWRTDYPKEFLIPYCDFYDEETANFVYENKKQEFIFGGYQKDSWKTLVK
jgi:hypothetical protein